MQRGLFSLDPSQLVSEDAGALRLDLVAFCVAHVRALSAARQRAAQRPDKDHHLEHRGHSMNRSIEALGRPISSMFQ
ncbi:hypothetical protein [Microbacterium sp. KCTC 39802]|uniref:hypothetical protein n=1 Tax=Microbacterium sp. KCTC 39802 TaxID=2183895 RepID=UPI0013A579C2|nr:hypothetical protein [Microbacterium sp. KCTC 39802]